MEAHGGEEHRGLTNREIVDELYLSVNTVKSHVAKVFAKLGVGNRTQAAKFAIEPGVDIAALLTATQVARRQLASTWNWPSRPVISNSRCTGRLGRTMRSSSPWAASR